MIFVYAYFVIGLAMDRSRRKLDFYEPELPATSLAEQRKPEYTPLHGNQATQAPPEGGSHRTEPGAAGREAQDWSRDAFIASDANRITPSRHR